MGLSGSLGYRSSRLQEVGRWAWDDLGRFPSSLSLGVGGQSYSNFPASTVSGSFY